MTELPTGDAPTLQASRVIASAPGKLILFGEYAVLHGGEAMVIAINRRALAQRVAKPKPLSPFLAEAELLIAELELELDEATIRVDTSSFSSSGRKLGFGSSAAATVAYISARTGGTLSAERTHELAHRAHGNVGSRQGARGSGIDIAASVWGGALATRCSANPVRDPAVHRPVTLPTHAVWLGLDSGQSANTRTLVAAVEGFADAKPTAFKAALREINASAAAAVAACEANDASALVDAAGRGFVAIERLGIDSRVPLVIPKMLEISKLAADCGGAAKPTGAAGGDAAWATFKSAEDAAHFRDRIRQLGIKPLELSVDYQGLRNHDH